MILTLALLAALHPWGELAVRDVEAIRAEILANHPGPVDPLNPGFRQWLDSGYEKALAKAREAQSFGGYAYAVRYYGAGFRDGHLNSWVSLSSGEASWPRFLVRLRNGRYVVAAVADPNDASLPAVGSELLDCDGRSARTMVEEDLFPYAMGPMVDSTWAGVSAELLIDRGNPWVTRAKSCRFKIGDETKSVAIQYRRANDETIREVAKRAAATLDPLPPVRKVENVVWVSIPSFQGSDEATVARLKELVAQAPQWRSADAVVFDVRGNGGGNSAWGDQILNALYGEAFVSATVMSRFSGQSVDWRVSKENLRHVREIVEDVKQQQGAESETAKYFQQIADGMSAALAEGKPLYRRNEEEEAAPQQRDTSPLFRGKVVLLTDRRCASACLDFADRVRFLPDATHLGHATSADSVYMEVRPVSLPSGVGRLALPVKVYRDRPRGHNEPYVPKVAFDGDINDTAALEKWVAAQWNPPRAQGRPVNTFSIVARDPATGQMGVAVQSHWFAVGQIVPWAEAGVGAIATQSFVDPSYGKLGLELLRAGKSAPDALRALLGADASCEVRQVAFVDASGAVATFTGSRAIVAAGGIAGNATGESKPQCGSAGGTLSLGRDFAVQANLMANDRVWPAMAKAFGEAKGDLAERMLAALDAAQGVGGDIRGKQSAALIVVNAKSTGRAWQDRVFDLRVDDDPSPLAELRRLVTLQRAYNHMNAGDLAVEHKDNEAALREYSAAERIAATTPGIPPSRHAEMIFWHAAALINMQRVDEALPLFARAFALEPSWRELTPRLPAAGLLPNDAQLISRIVNAR